MRYAAAEMAKRNAAWGVVDVPAIRCAPIEDVSIILACDSLNDDARVWVLLLGRVSLTALCRGTGKLFSVCSRDLGQFAHKSHKHLGGASIHASHSDSTESAPPTRHFREHPDSSKCLWHESLKSWTHASSIRVASLWTWPESRELTRHLAYCESLGNVRRSRAWSPGHMHTLSGRAFLWTRGERLPSSFVQQRPSRC